MVCFLNSMSFTFLFYSWVYIGSNISVKIFIKLYSKFLSKSSEMLGTLNQFPSCRVDIDPCKYFHFFMLEFETSFTFIFVQIFENNEIYKIYSLAFLLRRFTQDNKIHQKPTWLSPLASCK